MWRREMALSSVALMVARAMIARKGDVRMCPAMATIGHMRRRLYVPSF
jgi:hypothetical protein